MTADPTAAPVAVPSRDMAKMLSISERALWSLTSPRGPVPVLRIGRSVRYVPSDVLRALATQRGHGNE